MQYYSDHQSISKIREHFSFTRSNEDFKFKQVTESDICKLLKKIDGKKSTGLDKIFPKLVKKPAWIISKPLFDAINYSLLAGIFPDDAKNSSLSRIDKESEDKIKKFKLQARECLKLLLCIICNSHQNATSTVSCTSVFSLLGFYIESCNTQHVLIRLLEE